MCIQKLPAPGMDGYPRLTRTKMGDPSRMQIAAGPPSVGHFVFQKELGREEEGTGNG